MNKNPYFTKLPFYRTDNFGIQPMLLQNKPEAQVNRIHATIGAHNHIPEFIFGRVWVSTGMIDGGMNIRIRNVTDNVNVMMLNYASLLASGFIKHYVSQTTDGSAGKLITMFSGLITTNNFFQCGKKYQYRIEFMDDVRYYSEVWEAHPVSFTEHSTKYTQIMFRSNCAFHGIAFEKMPSFSHVLWLPSAGVHPDFEINQEDEQTPAGDLLSSFSRLTKKYLFSMAHVSQGMVDAISSLPLYVHGENKSCIIFYKEYGGFFTKIVSVDLDKPDYTYNELAPQLKIRIQVDPSLVSSGCCDTNYEVCYTGRKAPTPVLTTVGSDFVVSMPPGAIEPTVKCANAQFLRDGVVVVNYGTLDFPIVKSMGALLSVPGDYTVRVTVCPFTGATFYAEGNYCESLYSDESNVVTVV